MPSEVKYPQEHNRHRIGFGEQAGRAKRIMEDGQLQRVRNSGIPENIQFRPRINPKPYATSSINSSGKAFTLRSSQLLSIVTI